MSDRQKENNPNTEDGNFSEKTNRLHAWVQMIRAIVPLIWAIVILIVIIPLLGQFFIAKAFPPNTDTKNIDAPQEIVVQTVDWSGVDRAMVQALTDSRDSAQLLAAEELDIWINELMNRVDESFLDWYFGYFNQKKRELKSFFTQVMSSVRCESVRTTSAVPRLSLVKSLRDRSSQFHTYFNETLFRV